MQFKEALGTVVENRAAGTGLFVLKIKWAHATLCTPGCFVNVKIPSGGEDPFLRRPFSVSWCEPEASTIELLIQVRGKGTRILSECAPGEQVSLLGPLGNGFPVDALRNSPHPLHLIAGGVGAAPLLFLHKTLCHDTPSGIRFFLGARTGALIPEPDLLKKRVPGLALATDDGSAGFRGTVLALYREKAKREGIVCACGPVPLLDALRIRSKQHSLQTLLSLETFMACGYGVCKGCVVESHDGGYVTVCSDGPIFPAEALGPLQPPNRR